jgi:hypothetical protein
VPALREELEVIVPEDRCISEPGSGAAPALMERLTAQTGQSPQEYLLELITREAQQPTLAETAERTQRYARALRKEHASQ